MKAPFSHVNQVHGPSSWPLSSFVSYVGGYSPHRQADSGPPTPLHLNPTLLLKTSSSHTPVYAAKPQTRRISSRISTKRLIFVVTAVGEMRLLKASPVLGISFEYIHCCLPTILERFPIWNIYFSIPQMGGTQMCSDLSELSLLLKTIQ